MADVAKGTVFDWGGTTITEVTNFSGPGLTHTMLDTSDLSDAAKTFICSGLYDPGELTLDINFEADASSHDALADDLIAGTTRALTVTWQNGTAATNTYSANAYVSSFAPAGSLDDKLTGSVTIKLSGTMTIA